MTECFVASQACLVSMWVSDWVSGCMSLLRALTVKGSFFATFADQSCNHRLARTPVQLMHIFAWRDESSLTTWPYFNCFATANYGVGREHVHYFWFVVHFALDLPFAYVLVATFASVFDEYKFSIRTYFFYANGTLRKLFI